MNIYVGIILNLFLIYIPWLFPTNITDVIGVILVILYTVVIVSYVFIPEYKVFEFFDKQPKYMFTWWFMVYSIVMSSLFLYSWFVHGYYYVTITELIAILLATNLELNYREVI